MTEALGFETMPFELAAEFESPAFENEDEYESGRRWLVHGARPHAAPSSWPRHRHWNHRRPVFPGAWPMATDPWVAGAPMQPPYVETPQASTADRVRWVQDALNRVLGLRLPLDGIVRPALRGAIRSFQQRAGLPPTGRFGRATKRALMAATAGTPAGEAQTPELYEAELETPAAPPRTARAAATLRYVKDFSGSAAECAGALRRAGKTKAQALAIIDAQVAVAITLLRKAAADLERGKRTTTTKDLFLKIFRVRPEFAPTWLKTTATIKDRGDVVATRCRRVADLLASGEIKFFCAINSTNCPDCGNDSRPFACSSWGDDSKAPKDKRLVICLGNAFWDDMKAGRTSSLLSTLMHEPFHIYYGRYVTEHRSTAGKFGGVNCIVQFVFETNGRAADALDIKQCTDMAVRQEVAGF